MTHLPHPALRMREALLLLPLALLALAALHLRPARAEPQDIAAVERSVVRVVLIATDGENAYFVGHGSGIAVAPDKILTNAHVVELLRTEHNLTIGIVPAQGTRSYGGRVIAYSPGNDLALVQLTEGRLPAAAFFSGAVSDGQHVTAIGYPAAVDRAQGIDLAQMVRPLPPVKTSGTVSMGRASHDFDTLLHTAPMAQGNSGGPLVDDCGRVLGINSFGSEAESDADAEFGFAVSNREVASFLRQAGVPFQRTAATCRSLADLDAEENRRTQEAQAKQDEQSRLQAEARDKKLAAAREDAEQDILTRRENAVAMAGVLMLFGGLALGAAMMFHVQGKERERLWAGLGGGVLILGAVAAFAFRPSFASIDEAVNGAAGADRGAASTGGRTPGKDRAQGENLCRIDESRSRITVSTTDDVPLAWADTGCVNGATQYVRDGNDWSRILVQTGDAAISANRFDPATGTLRVDRYLPDGETMAKIAALRSGVVFRGCSTDPAALEKLQRIQGELRSALPPQPNERLVYSCSRTATERP